MRKIFPLDAQSVGKLEFNSNQADVAQKAQVIRKAVAEKRATEGIHGRPEVLMDPMFYPAHDQRTETAKYKEVHSRLTVEKDLPCLVCGVRHSTLKDNTKNPYGASAMETHHHIVEWALANAIDPDLFSQALLPNLREKHKDNPDYKKEKFSEQEVRDWVDHSPDNLWVLCDVHHRHKWVGIHHVSYPMWAPQDLLKPEFVREVASAVKQWEDSHAKKPAPTEEGNTPPQ